MGLPLVVFEYGGRQRNHDMIFKIDLCEKYIGSDCTEPCEAFVLEGTLKVDLRKVLPRSVFVIT
jgi:hypothetical protein